MGNFREDGKAACQRELPEKSRDGYIDLLKGNLILLVVLGHFLLPVQSSSPVIGLFSLIYAFHMPAFIFLSGLMAKSVYRPGKGFLYASSSFRWDKLLQLLKLYVIFKLLVYYSEIGYYGASGPYPDLFHESGAPWYLMALMLWYLMIPLAENIGNHALTFALILLFSLFSGYFGGGLRDFLSLDRVTAFMPFFFLGYFLGRDRFRKLLHAMCGSGKGQRILRGSLYGFGTLLAAVIFFGQRWLGPFSIVMYGAWYNRFHPEEYPAFLGNQLWCIRLLWYFAAALLTLVLFLALKQLYDRNIEASEERILASWCHAFMTLGQRTLAVYVLHRPIRDILLTVGLIPGDGNAGIPELLFLLAGGTALTFLLAHPAISSGLDWLLNRGMRKSSGSR